MNMNTYQAKDLLLSEYSFLKSSHVQIIKQYISTDGRISNTFLVQSTHTKFERFIAKSFVHNSDSLRREYNALKILEEKDVPVPKLLIHDHVPQDFLLLEFIDGKSAGEIIKNTANIDHIFEKIGETTGKCNAVNVSFFGNLLEEKSLTWKEYQLERLDSKRDLVEKFLDKDLFMKITHLIEESKYILDQESNTSPVLVHHDIYMDNFLLRKDGELVLIDFGIAFGGRPLYDLAKFFIWDLSKYPLQKSVFLSSYSKYVEIPENFKDIMSFYIIRECFGMIDFFTKVDHPKMRDHAILTLKNLVNGEGVISELIS